METPIALIRAMRKTARHELAFPLNFDVTLGVVFHLIGNVIPNKIVQEVKMKKTATLL